MLSVIIFEFPLISSDNYRFGPVCVDLPGPIFFPSPGADGGVVNIVISQGFHINTMLSYVLKFVQIHSRSFTTFYGINSYVLYC